MFKRKDLTHLRAWLHEAGRKPLLLRGARQVGKSSLVKKLAEDEHRHLVEINFETQTLPSLKHETIQIDLVLKEIELLMGRKFNTEKDLLFFDEIQKSSNALASLRYFYEKYPAIPIIAAGSLLDFLLQNENISVPVGRIEFYFLGPVTFSDFLLAKDKLLLIEEFNLKPGKISEKGHELLLSEWQNYLSVGGMPESVQADIDGKDIFSIRKIQKNILNTYRADFLKYSRGSQALRCEDVLNYLPGHLGQKVKYSNINPNERAPNLKYAIHLLALARVILPVIHTNATSIPLKSVADESILKLFHLDCGLVNSELQLLGLPDLESPLQGTIKEQFVAQHLAYLDPSSNPQLFYWLQDKSANKAEVDFVYSMEGPQGGEIIPIEVKSGRKVKSRSLSELFASNNKIRRAIKFSPGTFGKKSLEKGTLYEIPIYLVERTNEILNI